MVHTAEMQPRTIALIHGLRGMYVGRWPHWTSETIVDQQPPEWPPTCSCELLITIGPSDGCSNENFQKWSSWTACSLRRTVCKYKVYACKDVLHGQELRCSSNNQDAASRHAEDSSSTWNHQMTDLTEFLPAILAGTVQGPHQHLSR